MTIYQSRSFAQKVKKMPKREKEILDQEIRRIVENPSIGDEKRGDLSGVFVHKFKIGATGIPSRLSKGRARLGIGYGRSS